ncbi:MAG: DNA cytosine methyltransferase [Caulobacterales bacterium]|uniref:DNA cytosine methyltransferase n=1 Tax=Glycocaulis sp. TaxID=1969725 RepID=UPI003FA16C48
MNLNAISLFAGAGGMDIGFEQAGFKVLVAVEQDPSCCETLRSNMRDTIVVQADVQTVTGEELLSLAGKRRGEIDAIIGGPPCQSFSLAGQRAGLNDPRGQMVREFIRLVGEVEPKTFVLENVKGMVNWSGGEVLRLIEDEFEHMKLSDGSTYTVKHQVLNAADFGVPQFRERVFVVGNKVGKAFAFPDATHVPGHLAPSSRKLPYRTVGEAILSLPPAEPPSEIARRVSGTIKGRRERHGY